MRARHALAAVVLSTACAAASTHPVTPGETPAMHLDASYRYRIDSFEVPAESRAEFEAAMNRNLAFLKTLPGFEGHEVFQKLSGPTTFNVVTIAAWKDDAAVEAASRRVRAHYEEIGFDMPGSLQRWGVKASLGFYAPAR